MKGLLSKRNIWVLMGASSLGMCVAPLIVFIGGIVGSTMAPEPSLSTLPVAALVIGTAVFVLPASRLMQRFGRKRVFVANGLVSVFSSLAAAWAINLDSFWGFNLAVAGLGASLAVLQQFRFAAMESVEPNQIASAASFILLGGLIAAFLGPELAHLGRAWFPSLFSGSFILLAGACFASALLLLAYKEEPAPVEVHTSSGGRKLSVLIAQPVLWAAVMSAGVGYAVMSYVMTATPVSMHQLEGHSLEQTKWVIQSHIAAMFLPSFFSGALIARFGVFRIMVAGLLMYVFCMAMALAGRELMHYWFGLVCLGVGWNFLFVAGTSLLPQSYRPIERFKVQGLNDFAVFGFQALASLSSGVVLYQFGWDVLVLAALPLMVTQIIVMGHWRRSTANLSSA